MLTLKKKIPIGAASCIVAYKQNDAGTWKLCCHGSYVVYVYGRNIVDDDDVNSIEARWLG